MATFRYSRKAPSQFLPGWGFSELLPILRLFPISQILSPLYITQHLRQQPCFTLLPATSLLSCSVDHLFCSPSDISTVHQSKGNLIKSWLQLYSLLPSTRSVISLFE